MFRIIDYKATEPIRKVDQFPPVVIPHSPERFKVAHIDITIPRRNANDNKVELIATVGLRGLLVPLNFCLGSSVMKKKSSGLKKEWNQTLLQR